MKRLSKSTAICLMLLVAVVSMFVVSAGLAAPAAPKPKAGGILKIADEYDGVSIGYPPKLLRAQSNIQAAPAIETLFRVDKSGLPVPWLATGYKNDFAKKTITITLRKGIKFHDGTDFNAEAVKWNLDEHVTAKKRGTERINSIDATSDNTLVITLTEWDSTLISNLTQTVGMMISPTACKKNGVEWAEKNPVGTGPFRFVKWDKDVLTEYEKFPGYWQKGRPYLDKIQYIPITDQMTRQLSLRKGEVDVINRVAAKDLAVLEKEGYAVTRRRTGSGAIVLWPDSNNPDSPFAKLKVRQATQHAIDTQALVKNVLFNEMEPANQWIYKGHWAYNPKVVGYPYDPAKAKKLLSEAGYPNGFKTKIIYRTNPQDDLIFTAVQGYLKTVGIDAELDPAQSARFDQIAYQGGKWEGLIYGGSSENPDVLLPLQTDYPGGGASRYFGWVKREDEYVKAIQNAVSAPDIKKKQVSVQEAMKLMTDKYCQRIFLYCPSLFTVAKVNVHNHGLLGTANGVLWTPEEAWIDR